MNIRVWSSAIVKSMVELLGFKATTMAWGDIFPAIQSGIVDGAICCTKTATYSIFAQSDVGTHVMEVNAISELTTSYASQRTLEKLSDEQRAELEAALVKASDDFFAYNRDNVTFGAVVVIRYGFGGDLFAYEEWLLAISIVGFFCRCRSGLGTQFAYQRRYRWHRDPGRQVGLVARIHHLGD